MERFHDDVGQRYQKDYMSKPADTAEPPMAVTEYLESSSWFTTFAKAVTT